jgi:hypothetical protein
MLDDNEPGRPARWRFDAARQQQQQGQIQVIDNV